MAVKVTFEREMVRDVRIKSVGRVVIVVISGEGLKAVNTSKQPTKYEIIHNLQKNSDI